MTCSVWIHDKPQPKNRTGTVPGYFGQAAARTAAFCDRLGAGVVNQIGDGVAVRQKAVAEHAAQLEEIRTREARARELKAVEEKAAQDKVAAGRTPASSCSSAGGICRFARPGIEVSPTNFEAGDDRRFGG